MDTASDPPFSRLIEEKRAGNLAKIPTEWLLPGDCGISPDDINSSSRRCVLDIPRSCGILSDQELKLTEDYDATDLIGLMRDGAVKSEEVVKAFCKRAAVAHQLVWRLRLPPETCVPV
jgi:hypothetical protein